MLKYLLFSLTILLSQAAFADEFMSIRNMETTEARPTEQVWLPGTVVVLPNGYVTLIEEKLASGELKTSSGTVITPDGKVKDTGKEIKLFKQDDLRIGARVKLPEGKEDIISEKLPDGTFRTKGGLLVTQDGKVLPQIKHVETFEEAEKFLPKTDKPEHEENSAPKASVNSIEDLLAFNEAVGPKAEKPKTEKPKKQPTPFVAKKGDKLTIPPGAAARKDYSFLKGCWRSKSVTYYRDFTPYEAPAELCFNGSDAGRFISYTGGVCSAKTKARFNSGVLLIHAAKGPCEAGSIFAYTMPRIFQCEGEGANTECYILAQDDTDKRRRFKSRARFYKK